MSKDIHKWSDGRYVLMFDEHTFFVWDNENDERMTALNVTKKLNELSEENEQLKEENDRIKTKGLDVLGFYESKLKNVIGTEDFQSVRDEIWIVRQVLYEMGVINDE